MAQSMRTMIQRYCVNVGVECRCLILSDDGKLNNFCFGTEIICKEFKYKTYFGCLATKIGK